MLETQTQQTRQQRNDSAGEVENRARLRALARRRFVLAPIMGLLTTILMTVFVGYHAVFTLFLGMIVGIGVLLVLPSPQKSVERTSR